MKGGDFSWPPVGTFRGHQRRPQLATSGYFLMATDNGLPEQVVPNVGDAHPQPIKGALVNRALVIGSLCRPQIPSRKTAEVSAGLTVARGKSKI